MKIQDTRYKRTLRSPSSLYLVSCISSFRNRLLQCRPNNLLRRKPLGLDPSDHPARLGGLVAQGDEGADRVLAFIPMGMVVGAILAIALVPLFPRVIYFPFGFPDGNTTVLRWCCTYELIGVILLLITAVVVAVKWHGVAALLLLLSSITAFSAMFTVLRPYEQNFLMSIIGWGLSAVAVLAIGRGLLALLGK